MDAERTYRATLAGDGQPGPVEERIGRRLVRLLDPFGAEAGALAAASRIEWIGPEGDALGRIPPTLACAELRRRLERALEAVESGDDRERAAVQDGLRRLEGWTVRLGDALSAPPPRRHRDSPIRP